MKYGGHPHFIMHGNGYRIHSILIFMPLMIRYICFCMVIICLAPFTTPVFSYQNNVTFTESDFLVIQIVDNKFNDIVMINSIKGTGDFVWVGTKDGVYKVSKGDDKAVPINIKDGLFGDLNIIHTEYNEYRIMEIGDFVWVATNYEIYKVDKKADEAILIGSNIKWVYEVYGRKNNKAIPIIIGRVNEIKEIDDFVWVGTEAGLYKIAKGGDKAIPIGGIKGKVHRIKDVGYFVWVRTDDRVYKITKGEDKAIPIGGIKGKVYGIKEIGDFVWVRTNNGAYKVAKGEDKAIPIGNIEGGVYEIKEVEGSVWIRTKHGVYKVCKGEDKAILIEYIEGRVDEIKEIGDFVWIATNNRVYKVTKGENKTISIVNSKGSVYEIKEIDDFVWIRTSDGLYKVAKRANGENKAISFSNIKGSVNKIEEIGDFVWVSTYEGLYRLEKGISISVEVVEEDSWWKQIIQKVTGKYIFISGNVNAKVEYKRISDGYDPYGKDFPREFLVIMEDTLEKIKTAKEKAAEQIASGKIDRYYVPLERNIFPLDVGTKAIYYSIRDKWGNTFYGAIGDLIVVPGPLVVSVSIFSLWLLLFLILFICAPYSNCCHDIMMNPWLRTYGSFGLLPLLMSVFPFIRQHILKRYLKTIRNDEDFARWQKQYVIPTSEFQPNNFGMQLKEHRKLFLSGQSGIGKTSYFKYLTGYCALNKNNHLLPDKAIPVFMPLYRYREDGLKQIFHAQLQNYGRIMDEELTEWFLKQGGFIIFIDGLNEIEEKNRNNVNSFIDKHWQANYLCISSHEYFKEFSWIEEIKLAALGKDEINKLLHYHLGDKKAEEVISKFNDVNYELCTIPQNLEFAIELVRQNKALPPSRLGLYEAVMAPILDTWIKDGFTNYSTLLYFRAYEMLSSMNQFIDNGDKSLPGRILERFGEKKLIISSGKHYYFQHDLIKAYLASKYFISNWRRLLEQQEFVDSNWVSMLEMVLLDFKNPDEIRDLLYIMISKNKQMAGDLFKLMQKAEPKLCQNWADDFKLKFGNAMLNEYNMEKDL